MNVKPMNIEQVIVGTVISEVAIAEVPQLRPLAPIAHAATLISLLFLVVSLLLLADEKLLRRSAH